MTTASERPTLDDTIRSVQSAGWQPLVYRDVGLRGPYPHFYTILSHLVKFGLEYPASDRKDMRCIVFQDDIQVTACLWSHLVVNPPPTAGVVSLYTPANLHNKEGGWHSMAAPAATAPWPSCFRYGRQPCSVPIRRAQTSEPRLIFG